jgi:hypothetical protein
MALPTATANESLEGRVARLEKLAAVHEARSARIDWSLGMLTEAVRKIVNHLKEKAK